MKKNISQFASYLFIFVFLFSCKKSENYTVTGRIVEDCAGNVPVANEEFHFVSQSNGGVLFPYTPGLSKTITTNSNGEFEFTYNSKEISPFPIYINSLFDDGWDSQNFGLIKANQNVNLGNFPIKNNITFKVNLNVTNSYSANDSLYILGPSSDTLALLSGPFTSGTYGPFTQNGYQGNFGANKDGVYQKMRVRVTSNILQPSSNVKIGYSSEKKIKQCDQSEQLFEIEVN